ncbi:FP25K [Parapoynx stagnalis nucleopolyhedrovirus]|uniref:FP25K n=1 Tax=Parapoynx stagnalis nucleopolyhedrovirus TaxID=2993413 RepID=A0A9E7YIY9_9ABAC|nr:FP25K [Parapoynx stagnalis nucleopolyhedrovirus]
MDQFDQLINVSLLKSLINNQINENVSSDIKMMSEKLQKLEHDSLTDCVEIYGIHNDNLNVKKIRNMYLKKICTLLNLSYKHILDSTFVKNHVVVKLCDSLRAKEWQTRSREFRLKNYNLNIDFDGPIKIFVAASADQKLLLKKTRDALLPYYKYISICKNGIMVRRDDKSRVFIVKNEQNIEYLKQKIYNCKILNFENSNSESSQHLI